MKKVLILNKKEGETPLEALENFRAQNKQYKDVKMTYAGRLDPLVKGLMVILVGNKTQEKEEYLRLSKEYKFDVLFGFSTDTHDILGKVESSGVLKDIGKDELRKGITQNLKFFTGEFIQDYPMYSSKTVFGKPLFTYARANTPVKRPKHKVRVTSLKFVKLRTITSSTLLANIERRIAKVQGDFRQEEILKIWRRKLKKRKTKFFLVSFYVKCGSGMYVRQLSYDLGREIGISALAFSIKRTKIGKWKL